MPPKSPPPPRSVVSSNQNITEVYQRTASPDPEGEPKIENYSLPPAVDLAMFTWTKNANNMALIMTLFAAVQIILIQLLPSPSDETTTPLWKTTRFFMYTGILLYIGGAISAVAVVQMAATLPLRGRHLCLVNPNSLPARIYLKKDLIPQNLLYENTEVHLLEEWGLKKRWKFVAYHMMLCFLLGFVSASLSLALWIFSWELSWAAIGASLLPMFVLTGGLFWTVLMG